MNENKGGFTPTPRKKNALDFRKLNLSTPCPTAQGKYSALIWGVHANNPRLTVYTGDPEDSSERTNYGRISANLDTPTFFVFLTLLNAAIESVGEYKTYIENKNYTWFGGKKSDKPVEVSKLWVGKDKEGCVYISVTADNRPKIKFSFLTPEFHNLVHGDGTQMSKAEASVLFARAHHSILTHMVPQVLVNEYVDDTQKKQDYGNRSGGGGQYQKQSPQPQKAAGNWSDEDIPF